MKFNGILIGEASGSIAGVTFSHNAGGQYTRKRVVPVNANTVQQQAVRAIFGQLTAIWNNTLTQIQRDLWIAYADAVLIPDTLGVPRKISGLAMYVKCNTARLQAGETRIDAGPTILTLAALTAPTFTAASGTGLAAVTFTNTDTWAGTAGGHLFCYFSRGQGVTINYFKGPYRFGGDVDGNTIPPTSPASITLPFAVASGQKVFGRFACSNADGRPSLEVRTSVIAT